VSPPQEYYHTNILVGAGTIIHTYIAMGTTDSGGHYSVATALRDHKSTHEIGAWTQHISSEYEESNAFTTYPSAIVSPA
jgi:hypothetical protein